MNKKHVTSLELSKELKELGVPQESEFYWCQPTQETNGEAYSLFHWEKYDLTANKDWRIISAFLSSELGEIIAENDNSGMYKTNMPFVYRNLEACQFEWQYKLTGAGWFAECKEAEARGEVLKHLIEKELISFK